MRLIFLIKMSILMFPKQVVKTVTLSLANGNLSGAKAGNYSITDQTTNNAKILKRAITIRADDRSKTYGDTIALGSTAFSLTSGSFVGSESISSATLAQVIVTILVRHKMQVHMLMSWEFLLPWLTLVSFMTIMS